VSVGVCYTAVDAAAGGLTTGWWAVVLECFSSHALPSITGLYYSRSESLTSINSDLEGGAYNYPDLASLGRHVDLGALDGVMK